MLRTSQRTAKKNVAARIIPTMIVCHMCLLLGEKTYMVFYWA